MAYCTQADLSERFGNTELSQLTDEAAASPQAPEIIKAIDEAGSLIDSYISTRYDVPVSPVPTILRKLACDIARKYLWKDRADDQSVVTKNYADAVAFLRDVARGLISLDAAGEPPAASDFSIAVVAPAAIFTADVLDRMPASMAQGTANRSWDTLLP